MDTAATPTRPDDHRAAHWREVVIPPQIRSLPRDARGYPTPFFAAIVNGEPNAAVVDPAKVALCVTTRRCGICGGKLAALAWYIGGPNALQRQLAIDPPMHLDCARFSIEVCPHLALKNASYREERGVALPPNTVANVAMSTEKPERYALMGTEKMKMRPDGLTSFKRPTIVHWYAYDPAGRLRPAPSTARSA